MKIHACPLPPMTMYHWRPSAAPHGPAQSAAGMTAACCADSFRKGLVVLLLRRRESPGTTGLSLCDTGQQNAISPLTEVCSSQTTTRLKRLRPSILNPQSTSGDGIKAVRADHCPPRDTALAPEVPVLQAPIALWSSAHKISSQSPAHQNPSQDVHLCTSLHLPHPPAPYQLLEDKDCVSFIFATPRQSGT